MHSGPVAAFELGFTYLRLLSYCVLLTRLRVPLINGKFRSDDLE